MKSDWIPKESVADAVDVLQSDRATHHMYRSLTLIYELC